MGFDNRHQNTVMFGGTNNNDPIFSDTWTWDGASRTWTEQHPSVSPSARGNGGMAYDFAAGRVILFGGGPGGNIALSDTWSWNGTDWEALSPASSPGPRAGHAMVSDPDRARIIMWGGTDFGSDPQHCPSGSCSETWEWDGGNWGMVATIGPPARVQPGMAYLGGGRVLLFGGLDAQQHPLGDTWMFDGLTHTWSQLWPATSPPARGGHVMMFESDTGRVLLYGGDIGTQPMFNDTWEFDGVNWHQVFTPNSPPARSNFAGVYDSVNRVAVFFGGSRSGIYDTPETCVLDPATLCPADFNHDHHITSQDFFDFIAAFFSNCP